MTMFVAFTLTAIPKDTVQPSESGSAACYRLCEVFERGQRCGSLRRSQILYCVAKRPSFRSQRALKHPPTVRCQPEENDALVFPAFPNSDEALRDKRSRQGGDCALVRVSRFGQAVDGETGRPRYGNKDCQLRRGYAQSPASRLASDAEGVFEPAVRRDNLFDFEAGIWCLACFFQLPFRNEKLA